MAGSKSFKAGSGFGRQRGSASQVLDAVHNGDVDILIGTQIVAKGHDFKNVGLVVVLNTDPQLFSSDYRARERLFSVLMQVSGRAGRDKTEGKVLIQTRYTEDDIFKHLKSQDYEGFAAGELEARRASFMVPFSAQALIVAEGKEISSVLLFLQKLRHWPRNQKSVHTNFRTRSADGSKSHGYREGTAIDRGGQQSGDAEIFKSISAGSSFSKSEGFLVYRC